MEEQSGGIPVKPCAAHTVRKAVIGDGQAVRNVMGENAVELFGL